MSEFYLSDLSEKDRPWDKHRDESYQVSNLYKGTSCDDYFHRIKQCSLILEFALAAQDEGERVFRLQRTRFCRVRHCPVCQWRRSLMWKARFLKALPQITADHPKIRWLFLTLTVRNCPLDELRVTLNMMNKAWHRMLLRKSFPGIGYLRATEITRGKDGTAHPHFHVLLMVKPSYFTGKNYLSQETWRQLWQETARLNYEPWVHVRSVKHTPGSDPTSAVICGLKETMKYTVKGDDLIADRDWLVELTYQVHKMRAVAVGGILKDYLSESEPDSDEELIHAGEDGDAEPDDPRMLFGWREKERRYKSID